MFESSMRMIYVQSMYISTPRELFDAPTPCRVHTRSSVRAIKFLLPLVFSLINVFLVLVPVPVPVNLVVPVRVLLDVLLL